MSYESSMNAGFHEETITSTSNTPFCRNIPENTITMKHIAISARFSPGISRLCTENVQPL